MLGHGVYKNFLVMDTASFYSTMIHAPVSLKQGEQMKDSFYFNIFLCFLMCPYPKIRRKLGWFCGNSSTNFICSPFLLCHVNNLVSDLILETAYSTLCIPVSGCKFIVRMAPCCSNLDAGFFFKRYRVQTLIIDPVILG